MFLHVLGPGYTRDWLPAYSFVSRARARRDTTRQDCFFVIPAHTGVTIVYCGSVVPALKCQLDDSVSQVETRVLRLRKKKIRRRYRVHPIYSCRLLKGKFYTLYENLREHPINFFFILPYEYINVWWSAAGIPGEWRNFASESVP